MPRQSKATQEIADLRKEMEELRSALLDMAQQANSTAETTGILGGPTKMVPVKNYSGNAVAIPYEAFGREHTLMLDSVGLKQTGTLPLDVWIALERNSKLVLDGYISRTDRPITNPNVIENMEEFIKSLREKDIESRITKMNNEMILRRLNQYLELLPEEQKSGKVMKMLDVVRRRIFEVSGVQIQDSDFITSSE